LQKSDKCLTNPNQLLLPLCCCFDLRNDDLQLKVIIKTNFVPVVLIADDDSEQCFPNQNQHKLGPLLLLIDSMTTRWLKPNKILDTTKLLHLDFSSTVLIADDDPK
jgi:hypothetical protein